MQDYKKKYQAEYMSSDIKPKGKILDKIQGSFRSKNKQDIKKELDHLEENQEAERLLDMWDDLYKSEVEDENKALNN